VPGYLVGLNPIWKGRLTLESATFSTARPRLQSNAMALRNKMGKAFRSCGSLNDASQPNWGVSQDFQLTSSTLAIGGHRQGHQHQHQPRRGRRPLSSGSPPLVHTSNLKSSRDRKQAFRFTSKRSTGTVSYDLEDEVRRLFPIPQCRSDPYRPPSASLFLCFVLFVPSALVDWLLFFFLLEFVDLV